MSVIEALAEASVEVLTDALTEAREKAQGHWAQEHWAEEARLLAERLAAVREEILMREMRERGRALRGQDARGAHMKLCWEKRRMKEMEGLIAPWVDVIHGISLEGMESLWEVAVTIADDATIHYRARMPKAACAVRRAHLSPQEWREFVEQYRDEHLPVDGMKAWEATSQAVFNTWAKWQQQVPRQTAEAHRDWVRGMREARKLWDRQIRATRTMWARFEARRLHLGERA